MLIITPFYVHLCVSKCLTVLLFSFKCNIYIFKCKCLWTKHIACALYFQLSKSSQKYTLKHHPHMAVIRGVYHYVTIKRPRPNKTAASSRRDSHSLQSVESGDEQTWRLSKSLWTANHSQLTRCLGSVDVFPLSQWSDAFTCRPLKEESQRVDQHSPVWHSS